jgi:two-component system sensor histidine kinase KdpD
LKFDSPGMNASDSRGGFAWAALACAATTAIAVPLRGIFAEANLILLYLLAVVLVTVRFGRRPGVLASLLAVLAFDVFLVPPYYSLTVDDSQDLLTFAIMLAVSLVVSHLTANLRLQAQLAQQGERRASALFDLSRELSGAFSNEQISDIGTRRLNATFGVRAMILFPDGAGNLAAPHTTDLHFRLADTAMVIAKLVHEREVSAGYNEGATVAAGVHYLPLRAPMRTRGVLVVAPADPEQEPLLQACAAQIALAVERVHYSEVAQKAMLDIESERLRNSLLSAMSHDVRTPLTAIVGLSSTLARGPVRDDGTVREISEAIRDEAIRMEALVTNLLDMARLHDGAVKLNRQWQLLEEVVGSALATLGGPLAGRTVTVSLPAALPLLEFDAVLLERVFCNLLDNAVKHGGATLAISAQLHGDIVEVQVEDDGPGLAHGIEQSIFDKFARGEAASTRPGVGLGLAICKAIVEAHGGAIRAANRAQGGARFTFTLPRGVPPSDEELE